MSLPKKLSASDELSKHLSENTRLEHLRLSRAIALGGAGASLAILVQLLQVSVETFFLKATVLAVSLSLPTWVTLAMIYELYIIVDTVGEQHMRDKWVQRATRVLLFIAALSLFVSVVGIFLHLMPESAWLFLVASAICYLLATIIWILLARFFVHSRNAR